jgi:hypothetical protein
MKPPFLDSESLLMTGGFISRLESKERECLCVSRDYTIVSSISFLSPSFLFLVFLSLFFHEFLHLSLPSGRGDMSRKIMLGNGCRVSSLESQKFSR